MGEISSLGSWEGVLLKCETVVGARQAHSAIITPLTHK